MKNIKNIITLKKLIRLILAGLVGFLIRYILIKYIGLNPQFYLEFMLIYSISTLSMFYTAHRLEDIYFLTKKYIYKLKKHIK